MAAFVVDIATAGEAESGPFGAPDFETVFVEAPTLIEAIERVLSVKPGADIVNASKGRPGTSILG